MGGVPMGGRDLALFDEEAAAFVEASQDSPSEVDVLEERAVDFGQAHGGFVEHELALHSGEDGDLAAGRIVAGAGGELEGVELMAVGSRVAVEVDEVKGVGDGGEHFAGAGVVLLLVFQFVLHLLGVQHGADARVLVPLLPGVERLVR